MCVTMSANSRIVFSMSYLSVSSVMIAQYSSLTSLSLWLRLSALLLYDYVLTLGSEIDILWHRWGPKASRIAFLALRL